MTLIELMIAMAITMIVVAGVIKALNDLSRTARTRNLVNALQNEGRDGLQIVARDVRQASLGSTLGVIWSQDSLGNVVQRPAIQVFDNLQGAGIDAKPGTDALLIVSARPTGAQTAVKGTHYDSTQTLIVTDVAGFNVGDYILVGPYQQAAWTQIRAKPSGPPAGFTLTATQNIYPTINAGGSQIRRLDAGSMVRSARARLYYVDQADELVRLELLVPRAPASLNEVGTRDVLARGVENLQVDCEADDGASVMACPTPQSGTTSATEAVWAFGAWSGGGGVRFDQGNIPNLRSVVLSTVLRSQSPVLDQQGDDPIALGNHPALGPGGSDPTGKYVRRAYRFSIAVRNVSLGAF